MPDDKKDVATSPSSPSFPKIDWTIGQLDQDLRQLAQYAMQVVSSSRSYYSRSVGYKRNWAKALRITAIICGALGGLIPILSQIANNYGMKLDPAWATVAISIGITALGLDRYFGFSSAWMRFITAEMKIAAKMQSFQLMMEAERFTWAGKPPTFDQGKAILSLIVSLITEVSNLVQEETNAWMTEFQNIIQKLNEEMNVKYEAAKLAGLNVIVENGDKYPKGVRLQLEGKDPVILSGTTYSFNNLYPMMYKVAVDADNYGRPVRTEALANVQAGGVASITLRLPEPQPPAVVTQLPAKATVPGPGGQQQPK